jgi:NTP pyrophosphatase (non-canonical NTP hydrolase)
MLNQLRKANTLRNQVWDPDNKLTPLFCATELAGEVGEACNVVKKLEREAMGLRGSRASVDDLALELADVLICTDLLARQYNINLTEALVAKFNATSDKLSLDVFLTENIL